MRALLFVCLLPVLAFAQTPELDSNYIPKNVHVTSSAPQSATLEWDKTDGATAYRVWYGISADNMDYAGDTPFPQFQKSHLMEGAKYYFSISTVVDTKESPRSAPLACQLPSSSPQPWAVSSMPPQQPETTAAADTSKKLSTDTSKATATASVPPAANHPADTAKTAPVTATTPTSSAPTAAVTITSTADTTKTAATSTPVATASVTTSSTTEQAAPSPNTAVQNQPSNSTAPATTNNTVTVASADTTPTAPLAQPAAPSAPAEVPPTPPVTTPAPVTPPPAIPPQRHTASTRVGNAELAGIASSHNCYTVQIEASKNLPAVQGHLQILEARGVDQARIEEFVNNGVKWYRLRAGVFTSREQAATKLASLRWTHKAFGSSGPLVFYNDRVVK